MALSAGVASACLAGRSRGLVHAGSARDLATDRRSECHPLPDASCGLRQHYPAVEDFVARLTLDGDYEPCSHCSLAATQLRRDGGARGFLWVATKRRRGQDGDILAGSKVQIVVPSANSSSEADERGSARPLHELFPSDHSLEMSVLITEHLSRTLPRACRHLPPYASSCAPR